MGGPVQKGLMRSTPPRASCRQRPSVPALLSALLLMLPADACAMDADAECGGPPPELNGLFQWAIAHSDAEAGMDHVERARLLNQQQDNLREVRAVQKRHQRVGGFEHHSNDAHINIGGTVDSNSSRGEMAAQLLDAVKWEPTPSQLLAARVAVLAAEDMCTAVDAQTALLDIKEMLAQFPVEFSTDLYGMGGVHALISQLDRSEAEVRTAAFWALGTAAANNPDAQAHQLAAGLLPRALSVLDTVHSSMTDGSEQEGVKALYALSGLIRHNLGGRTAFYAEGGVRALGLLLSNPATAVSMRRKALQLIGDLAADESDAGSDGEALQDGALAAAALRMLTDSQLPVVEAAVHALRQLTSATTGGAATLRAAGASTQLHESTRALRQRATEGAEGLVEWVEELTSELERLVAELDGDS